MAYQRKTRDVWEVQANYGYGDGWECAAASTSFKDARNDLKAYRENAPQFQYRIKMYREKIA